MLMKKGIIGLVLASLIVTFAVFISQPDDSIDLSQLYEEKVTAEYLFEVRNPFPVILDKASVSVIVPQNIQGYQLVDDGNFSDDTKTVDDGTLREIEVQIDNLAPRETRTVSLQYDFYYNDHSGLDLSKYSAKRSELLLSKQLLELLIKRLSTKKIEVLNAINTSSPEQFFELYLVEQLDQLGALFPTANFDDPHSRQLLGLAAFYDLLVSLDEVVILSAGLSCTDLSHCFSNVSTFSLDTKENVKYKLVAKQKYWIPLSYLRTKDDLNFWLTHKSLLSAQGVSLKAS